MKYLVLALMCFVVLGFSACGDDEKDPVTVEETADASSDAGVTDAQASEGDTAAETGDAEGTEESTDASEAEEAESDDARPDADAGQ